MKRPNIHKYPWEAQEYIQHLESKLESMASSMKIARDIAERLVKNHSDLYDGSSFFKITTMEQIIYKGVRIDKKECIEKGDYWHIPRRLSNKFSNEGYDLVPKKECLSLDEYIKKLEHHEATTVGLFATDRLDLISDPEKIMFEITN